MASYGTNAATQITAFGAANSDLDTVSGTARDLATSMINSKLGLKKDLASGKVPNNVTRCANTLAAAIISSSPEEREQSMLWKLGMNLLEELGDEATSDERDKFPSIHVEGFGRRESGNHLIEELY